MKEMIDKLNKLIQENPDCRVEILVNSEELCEEYKYTQHGIESVELSKWYVDEIIGMFLTGLDNIIEHLEDEYELSTIDATEKAMKESDDVILIKTGAA
jgi:hypothetical protein